jgi:hypothetical protein
MAELDPWYVTGFCDGEAAFTYSRTNGSFGVYFAIKQREDNRQIVEDIRAYFNCVGNIYYGKAATPTKNSGFTKPSAYYRVTRIDELKDIIDHFDRYPLLSKKKFEAYQVWRQMVIHKAENFRSTNYDLLRELASKLSNLNSKSRAFKVHTR